VNGEKIGTLVQRASMTNEVIETPSRDGGDRAPSRRTDDVRPAAPRRKLLDGLFVEYYARGRAQ